MPRIPDFRVGTTQLTANRPTPEVSQTGTALSSVSQSVGGFAQARLEGIKREGETQAVSDFADFQIEVIEEERRLREQFKDRPNGFTDAVLNRVGELKDERVGNSQNEFFQSLFEKQFQQSRVAIARNAIGFEATQKERIQKQRLANARARLADAVYQNPDFLKTSLGQLGLGVKSAEDGNLLDVQSSAAARKNGSRSLFDAAINRHIDDGNSELALELVNGNESVFGQDVGTLRRKIKQASKAEQQAAIAEIDHRNNVDVFEQIKFENELEQSVYDTSIPLHERIRSVRAADFGGNVRDDFATEAIQFLNSQKEKANNVTNEQKLQKFNELTGDLQNLRISLGGTSEASGDIKVDGDTLKGFQNFQQKVFGAVSDGEITEGEAKAFTGDFSNSITLAIEENLTRPEGNRLAFGVQDAYGVALNKIDSQLKNEGRESDLSYKKDLVFGFQRHLGEYKSSGSAAEDEQVILKALRSARLSVNGKNFSGVIDEENPPNFVVQGNQSVPPENTFDSEEALEAARLPVGTIVIVNGVKGRVTK